MLKQPNRQSATTTLVVKHASPEMVETTSHARQFFDRYNAINVRVMQSAAMKGTVFLDFASPESAEAAFHQLEQLKSDHPRLRVEYAKSNPKQQQDDSSSTAIAPSLNITYPSNPHLRYQYPDPTPEILTNIMHAIGSVPRLYCQVLHLMNKMNLPPPFGPIESESIPSVLQKKRKHDELVASDESEMESDEEQKQLAKDKEKARRNIIAAQQQKKAILLGHQRPRANTESNQSESTLRLEKAERPAAKPITFALKK